MFLSEYNIGHVEPEVEINDFGIVSLIMMQP